MSIKPSSDNTQNIVLVIRELLSVMKIRVTQGAINKITQHPDYPGIIAIHEIFQEWNIDSIAVNLTSSQLKEISYPAIAHLHKNGGHFIVLHKINNNTIHYFDPEKGIVQESLDDFEKKWTGAILLVELNEKSGERDYESRRKKEIFNRLSCYISLTFCGIILLMPLITFSLNLSILYFLKIAGTAISFILLKKQFGPSHPLINSLCKTGNNNDCDVVLHSTWSTLFGVIHLSELAFLYFVGCVLSIIISSLFPLSLANIFFILSLVTLPVSLLSIYYQKFIIKKWCSLCLAVVVVLWAELAAHMLSNSTLEINWTSFSFLLLGFIIPFLFWTISRQPLIDSFSVKPLERRLNRFLKNEYIFQELLKTKPLIPTKHFPKELSSGTTDVSIEIIIVSNPTCGPCSYAHSIMVELAEYFKDRLNIIYRFYIDTQKTDDLSYLIVKNILGIRLTTGNSSALHALSEWYTSQKRSNQEILNIENLKLPYFLDQELNTLLQEHNNWCRQIGIQKTPTIFINGKELPDEFLVHDLAYHINKMLEYEETVTVNS